MESNSMTGLDESIAGKRYQSYWHAKLPLQSVTHSEFTKKENNSTCVHCCSCLVSIITMLF